MGNLSKVHGLIKEFRVVEKKASEGDYWREMEENYII